MGYSATQPRGRQTCFAGFHPKLLDRDNAITMCSCLKHLLYLRRSLLQMLCVHFSESCFFSHVLYLTHISELVEFCPKKKKTRPLGSAKKNMPYATATRVSGKVKPTRVARHTSHTISLRLLNTQKNAEKFR